MPFVTLDYVIKWKISISYFSMLSMTMIDSVVRDIVGKPFDQERNGIRAKKDNLDCLDVLLLIVDSIWCI